MSKQHAAAPKAPYTGVGGVPLCGSRNKDRYNIVTLTATEWNATDPANRCTKCVEKIRVRRANRT